MKKLNFELVKQKFEERGYNLISTEYDGANVKMEYICPLHPDKKNYISYSNLKQGVGCPYCAKLGKASFQDVKQAFKM